MPEKPTMYVVMNHAFNHTSAKPGAKPIDERFLKGDKNYVYYLIDKEIPEELKNKQVLQEHLIDPCLYEAGANHLAEWSFLLAEEKHGFCDYPFFMISSRFYEKNHWLKTTLDKEWDKLFSWFSQYRYGFLPSYDRPLRWIEMNWRKKLKQEYWRYAFFPWKEKCFELIQELYGIAVPEDYRYIADLQCNYIGFRDRQALIDYVAFYRKIIDFFFDEHYQLKINLDLFFRKAGFRKEKPLTFLLEIFSHLYFFVQREKVFTLHYQGYYEVDERKTNFDKLSSLVSPFKIKWMQRLRWLVRRSKIEGFLAPFWARWKGEWKTG